MWGNHISILYYIKKKEKEELIGPIEYDGVQYPSITACCHEYGVSPYTVTSYIRKHECKVNDALKICIMNKQKEKIISLFMMAAVIRHLQIVVKN